MLFFNNSSICILELCLSTYYLKTSGKVTFYRTFFPEYRISGSAGKRGKEVPNLLINLVLSSNRLGDFIPQQLAVTSAEAMEKTLAFDTDFKHTFSVQTYKELNDGR